MSTMQALALEASACTRCPLWESRTQVVWARGNPDADLVFVGEAPGAEEDASGLPFVGKSGRLLDRVVLEELGLTDEAFYVMNCLKCRPPGNRDPRPDELTACSGWFDAQLEQLDPVVVVPLGNFAARALLGRSEGITRLRGRSYPWRGRILVPTYHPAAVLRQGPQAMAEFRADLVRAKVALEEVRA